MFLTHGNNKLNEMYTHGLTWILDGWLVGFYGITIFEGYLMPNPFYTNNQFHFKQFSLAWVYSLSKTVLFQTHQVSQTVLNQTTWFSINLVFC